jgi:hypothetical protein
MDCTAFDDPPPPGAAVGTGATVGAAVGVGDGAGSGLRSGPGAGTCDGTLGPAPDAFTATTRNVYFVPGANPVNSAVPPAPPLIVTDCPPGIAITVIDVIGEDPESTGASNDTARPSAPTDLTPVTSGIPGAPSAIAGICSGSTDTHRFRLSDRPSHPPDTMIRATPVASFTHVVTTDRTSCAPAAATEPAPVPASPDRAESARFAASSAAIAAQSRFVNFLVSPPVFSTTACASVLAENTRPSGSSAATADHPWAISDTGSHDPRASTRVTPVARFRHVDSSPPSFATAVCGHDTSCSPAPTATATSTATSRAPIRAKPEGMTPRTSNRTRTIRTTLAM